MRLMMDHRAVGSSASMKIKWCLRRLPGNLRNVYGNPCIRWHGQRPRYEGYFHINICIPNTFVQVEEQNYVLSANEDVEMFDVENEADEEDEVESELDPDEGRIQAQHVFYINPQSNPQNLAKTRKSMKRMKKPPSSRGMIAIHSLLSVTRGTAPTLFAVTILEFSVTQVETT